MNKALSVMIGVWLLSVSAFADEGEPWARYFLTDHRGSTVGVFNGFAGVLDEDWYFPSGARISVPAPSYVNNNDYLYCGKERQTFFGQGGWYDFGARYLDTEGHFTSLDPLCEKTYPVSPYSFCAGDPVNFVDPDGRKVVVKGSQEFVDRYYAALDHLLNHGIIIQFKTLYLSDNVYKVVQSENSEYDGYGRTIKWNPNHMRLNEEKTIMRSPTVSLSHEFSHAYDHETNTEEYLKAAYTEDAQYGSVAERTVITGPEQTAARALGEITDKQVTRTSHFGRKSVNVKDLSPEDQSFAAGMYNIPIPVLPNQFNEIAHLENVTPHIKNR